MEHHVKKMAKKGWSKKEIDHALKTLRSKEKLSKHLKYRENTGYILYWTGLVLLAVCNFVVSVVLVPFLIALPGWQIYLMIILLSTVFGLLFNLIINDIEHVEKKHHLFASVFIPIITVINLFIMVNVANSISTIMGLPSQHSPLLISVIYAVFFILPYVITRIGKNL